MPRAQRGFRLNSAQLFLTYPQCRLDKQKVYDYLTVKFNNPINILVAHELHANGDDHLHVYLKLATPVDYSSANCLDLSFPGEPIYHGNYQGVRSSKNVVKYCSKKEDYIANFDVEAVKIAQNGKKKVIGTKLIEGMTITNLTKEYPELIFDYLKLKANIQEFLRDNEEPRKTLPPFLPNPWAKVLPSFKSTKKRHYWIWSSQPNKGKSYHFARPLVEEYLCYLKSGDFTYWSIRGDEQCIILDEYNTASLKFNFLNSMCDGSAEYRIFQGGVRKMKNPLIIVLSNQPIRNLYTFMYELLYARFNEIELI